MSAMTFGQRSFKQKPPEKGSFPLDHDGECKLFMIKYMKCLRTNDMSNADCRQQSKDYLQCRMEHNLMKTEEWDKLGFQDLADKEQKEKEKA